jgi:long-subunit fatty acid transport protein
MTVFAVWLGGAAGAASLDLLEVGGAFGTPAATNPTAVWWNPAGLAVHGGTQVYAEGAPTFGGVKVDRPNPDYGAVTLTPEMEAAGFPASYAYGGEETFRSTAVVPFLGASSDFGVDGLGVGLAVLVPSGRGASSTAQDGPNRYAIREGMILAPRVSLGAAYQVKDLVAFGLSGSVVRSSFYADSDVSTYPDVAEFARDALGGTLPPEFQDAWIEDPNYGATLVLGGAEKGGGHGSLTDTALTFGGGIYLTPLDGKLGISLAWNQGVKLTNTGTSTFAFGCPPTFDNTARSAAEDAGLCDAVVPAETTVSYQLPSRLHVGVALLPVDRVRLELMGAWVGWGVFDDYDVTLTVNPDDIDSPLGAGAAGQVATLLSQERKQARGARDTFWVGLDGKVDLSELVLVGARATFDRSALPTSYVSGNNLDADTMLLQALTQLRPSPKVGIGLSYTYALSGAREVTDSVFSQDLARANATNPDYYVTTPAVNRTFYPTANGMYALDVHRLGVSLQGRFGGAGRL